MLLSSMQLTSITCTSNIKESQKAEEGPSRNIQVVQNLKGNTKSHMNWLKRIVKKNLMGKQNIM